MSISKHEGLYYSWNRRSFHSREKVGAALHILGEGTYSTIGDLLVNIEKPYATRRATESLLAEGRKCPVDFICCLGKEGYLSMHVDAEGFQEPLVLQWNSKHVRDDYKKFITWQENCKDSLNSSSSEDDGEQHKEKQKQIPRVDSRVGRTKYGKFSYVFEDNGMRFGGFTSSDRHSPGLMFECKDERDFY